MDYRELEYRMNLRLWKDEKVFGPGLADLLEKVDEYQSLNKAAQVMGMAYSKAWRILKQAESGLGVQLLDRKIGGTGGGGARLTVEGRDILETYKAFVNEADEAVAGIFKKYFLDERNY